jgi:NTP pyrophosphatase (non-canonical NTP hydrolase)
VSANNFTFGQYHDAIKQTVLTGYPDFGDNLIYPALGLAGEAGEIADKAKKMWRDHECLTMSSFKLIAQLYRARDDVARHQELYSLCDGITKEIGDCLWYLDALATTLGTTLEACAQGNVTKLRNRMSRGTTNGSGDER